MQTNVNFYAIKAWSDSILQIILRLPFSVQFSVVTWQMFTCDRTLRMNSSNRIRVVPRRCHFNLYGLVVDFGYGVLNDAFCFSPLYCRIAFMRRISRCVRSERMTHIVLTSMWFSSTWYLWILTLSVQLRFIMVHAMVLFFVLDGFYVPLTSTHVNRNRLCSARNIGSEKSRHFTIAAIDADLRNKNNGSVPRQMNLIFFHFQYALHQKYRKWKLCIRSSHFVVSRDQQQWSVQIIALSIYCRSGFCFKNYTTITLYSIFNVVELEIDHNYPVGTGCDKMKIIS